MERQTPAQPFVLFKQPAPIDMFLGEWLRGKGSELMGGRGEHDEAPSAKHGWSDDGYDDISDMEDDAWIAGQGLRRPGEKNSEDFSSEEAMSEWETHDDDDDDDDHGGHMMPIPSLF